MSKEILINVSEGEETRIALLEDGKLEELYMERTSASSHVGNIYKGRVTNVEASIQAAFVDFGLGRNGFLHISDLLPSYFGEGGEDIQESVGRKLSRRDRPPIQKCLRRGDEIVVQIIKEGIGTKGPTLTTYLSIPGRILVMMPGMAKFGVSRKIEDEDERRRLRVILDSLKPIRDVGFIIRTAGTGKSKTDIQRDLTYLTRLWQTLNKKLKEPAPVELYTEGDLVTRTVRDVFTADVDRIVVDNSDVAKRVKDVIKLTMPRTKNRVDVYDQLVPLFHQAGIEREIEMMYSRHVPLPSGGSLVIDSTEAVVAIDVNSGKFREHNDAEMTAFKTDMEAADEIPRQLRLRDLGGVIICDFIDLRFDRNRRELEARLHENLKKDRAKSKVLRMSEFGIIELTRQRMRPSIKRTMYADCPHCKGAGLIKNPESMSLDVMRRIAIAVHDERVVRAEVTVNRDVANYLLNRRRKQLVELEDETNKQVIVRADSTMGADDVKLELFDARDGFIYLEQLNMSPMDNHVGDDHAGAKPVRGGGRSRRDERRAMRGGRSLADRGLQPGREDEDEIEDDLRGRPDDDGDEAPAPQQKRLPPTPSTPKKGLPIQTKELEVDDDEVEDPQELEEEEEEEDDSQVVELDDAHEPMGEGPRAIDAYDNDRQGGRNRGGGRDRGGRVGRDNRGGDRNNDQSREQPQNRQGQDNRGQDNRGQEKHGQDNRGRDNRGQPQDNRGRDNQRGGNRGGQQNRQGQPRNPAQGRQDNRGDTRGGQQQGRGNPQGGFGNQPRDNRGGQGRNQPNYRNQPQRGGQRPHPQYEGLPVDDEHDEYAEDAGNVRPPEPADVDSHDEQDGQEHLLPAPVSPPGVPAARGAQPVELDENGEPKKRRRRRRGGKRHRRRRERAEAARLHAEAVARGENPPPLPNYAEEDAADAAAGNGGSDPDDEGDDDNDAPRSSESADAAYEAPRGEPVSDDRNVDRYSEPREPRPEHLDDAPIHTPEEVVIEPEAETVPVEPDEEPAKAKPARSRRKAATPAASKTPRTTTVKSVKKPKAATKAKRAPSRVAPPPTIPPVVKTGSSDKHLASDTPIDPEPIRRPRSFRDLDDIPDDLD